MKIYKSESGFTMVELLGVIVIVLILAAIAIPELDRAREAGREAAMKEHLLHLNNALSTFQAAGGSIDDLRANAGMGSYSPESGFQRTATAGDTPWATAEVVIDRLSQPLQFVGTSVGPFLSGDVTRAMRKNGTWYRLGFLFPDVGYDYYADPSSSSWGLLPFDGFTFSIPYGDANASKSEILAY